MEETNRSVDSLNRPEGNDLKSNYDSLYDESAIDDLYELYVEKGMTQQEVADELGFSQHHVSKSLRRHDMDTRSHTDYIFCSVNLGTWSKGYERVYCGDDVLYHHRLIAVAEHGFDAVKDNVVHHKNECTWDNRVENLEIMSVEEHISMHNKNKNRNRDERGRFA